MILLFSHSASTINIDVRKHGNNFWNNPKLSLETFNTILLYYVGFWLIWYSTKRAYVIMICPLCIVVVWHWRQHHLASASAASALAASTSVHSPPSHRIQDRNFIFSMNMHMYPQYMHVKYLVILTCSF